MRFRILVLLAGAAIAGGVVLGAAGPSGAQVVATCTTTTATFLQPVGSTHAPVLVPMNLPVSECTLPHHVQVIVPAFQVAGTPPGSVVVPSGLPAATCGVSAVTVPTAGTTSSVQVVTVSGSTVTVISPATVGTPVVTCF